MPESCIVSTSCVYLPLHNESLVVFLTCKSSAKLINVVSLTPINSHYKHPPPPQKKPTTQNNRLWNRSWGSLTNTLSCKMWGQSHCSLYTDYARSHICKVSTHSKAFSIPYILIVAPWWPRIIGLYTEYTRTLFQKWKWKASVHSIQNISE